MRTKVQHYTNMKRITCPYIILFLVGCLLLSCAKQDSPYPDVLVVSPATLSLPQTAGSNIPSIQVIAPASWQATILNGSSWLFLSNPAGVAGSSRLILSYGANPYPTPRTASIVVTSANQSHTVIVTQNPFVPVSNVVPNAVTLAGTFDDYRAPFYAECLLTPVGKWTLQQSANSDWLSVSPTSGEDHVANLVVRMVKDNPTKSSRTATLTIKPANSASIAITVTQLPAYTQREALISLYRQMDGDHWTRNDNWCSDQPLGTWYGVTEELLLDASRYEEIFEDYCSQDPYSLFVTKLDLSNNNLNGNCITMLKYLPLLDSAAFSHNPRITKISVDNFYLNTLECNNSRLETLNIYSAPLLFRLFVRHNRLHTLDVSNATYLERLGCSPMKTLDTLYVARNQRIEYIVPLRDSLYIPNRTVIVSK